jgi:hypothetical protein
MDLATKVQKTHGETQWSLITKRLQKKFLENTSWILSKE